MTQYSRAVRREERESPRDRVMQLEDDVAQRAISWLIMIYYVWAGWKK